MSYIVVGFDFSSGSAIAVDMAIDIANKWHNDIRLVYVKERNEDEAPIRAEIERRNAGVAHLLKGIKLEYTIRQGKVSEELTAQADEDNATLIVVGTHGMSGLTNRWIGRNTYRTIAESKVPVLTLREDFNFNKALERIVVPLDSTDDTRQKVPTAMHFAKKFGSEIHIFGLYTSSSPDIRQVVNNYVRQTERLLDNAEIPHHTEMHTVQKNLTTETLEYADSINADMIVIMTEQENSLSNLLLGSFAHQMIELSKIPVLTVRPAQLTLASGGHF
ncbi:MAG: universal stress protein [Bacteroidales bacterium]|nr:universal stress protein [Bacteroidales bacterium]